MEYISVIQFAEKDWFAVMDYKKDPNEVEGNATCPPEQVHSVFTFPFSPPNTCFRIWIILSLRAY